MPTPPIYFPPTQPPVIWPSPGVPAHPIVLPPDQPVEPPEGGPPPGGQWVWSPVYGWVWAPSGSGGKPKPPGKPDKPGKPDDPDAPQVTPLPA